jgi:phytoene/squalene synthetase
MGSVYWQLLKKLEANRFNVFGEHPVRVSKPQKLTLIFRAWLRFVCNSRTPNYGTP